MYEHREKELDIEILELKNSPFPDNNTKVSFRSFLVFTRNIIKVSHISFHKVTWRLYSYLYFTQFGFFSGHSMLFLDAIRSRAN